jgi:hypothetical protein
VSGDRKSVNRELTSLISASPGPRTFSPWANENIWLPLRCTPKEKEKEKKKKKKKGEETEIEESRQLTSLELARVWPILLGSGSYEGTRRPLTLHRSAGEEGKTSWESKTRELIATYSTNKIISTHFSPLMSIQTTVNPHDVIRLLLSKPAVTFLSLLLLCHPPFLFPSSSPSSVHSHNGTPQTQQQELVPDRHGR